MATKKAAPKRGRLCFCHGGDNPYKEAPKGSQLIELRQHGRDNFSVRYGLQLDEGLCYARAARTLGQAIMHLLACDGMLDNRSKGES